MTGLLVRLPAGYLLYGRSPDFTAHGLPDALRTGHATKPGVWGLLRVSEGSVRFELEPPLEGAVVAWAGETIVIQVRNPPSHRLRRTRPLPRRVLPRRLTARTPLDDTSQPKLVCHVG